MTDRNIARRQRTERDLEELDAELYGTLRLLASARTEVDTLRQKARSLKQRRATAARQLKASA